MPSPSSLIAACRRLALHRQGLASAQPFGRGVAGTLRAIEHLGYVQIDTISVIERAHHHVLWSRVPAYRPAHLARLLQTRQVFEYWFHAAAYLPMRDYRFALPRMAQVRRDGHMWFDDADPRLMHEIMAQVRAEGPQRLRDLGRLAGESRTATPAVSVPVPQLDMAVAPGNEPSATTGNGNGDSSGTESDTAVAAAASDTGADTDTDATDITAAVAAPAGTVDTSLSGAWNWKPLRRALDTLFMRGELMICARQGMEKVYDLAERVLPADVDTRPPSIDEQALHLLDNGLRAHGIVTLPQVAHLRPGKPLRDSCVPSWRPGWPMAPCAACAWPTAAKPSSSVMRWKACPVVCLSPSACCRPSTISSSTASGWRRFSASITGSNAICHPTGACMVISACPSCGVSASSAGWTARHTAPGGCSRCCACISISLPPTVTALPSS